jgi:SAM-dependent methyltransferase
MVKEAQELGADIAELEFLEGNFLNWPFPLGGFVFVSFIASVHHMDTDAALTKATELLRPGGTLVVVGLARNATLADWLIRALSIPVNCLYDLRSDVGDPGHPMAEPKLSWEQVRKQAHELLPGARYRHHLHYRYSLIWTKPGLINAP